MRSLIRLGTMVLLVCTLFGAGPASRQAGAQPAGGGPPAVGVSTVQSRAVTTTSQYVGRVSAIDSVALVARVTAFLDQRLFVEGSEVKKGQLLYVLEQGPYQAQVLAQQGNLSNAQANVSYSASNFQRQKALLNTPAGQKQSFDSALATARGNVGNVLTAQGNLQAAQINLDYTEIKAPIDGRITATSVNPGNVVSISSGTLATIVSQDPMYVSFPIATRDLTSLQKKYAAVGGLSHAKLTIQLSNGDAYDLPGTLDYVAPTVSANTDTIALRGTFPNPEHGAETGGVGTRRLVDGAFVTVMISDPVPVTQLVIPRAAVLSDQQGDYVFALDAQNHAVRTDIKLGDSVDADEVVLSGLQDGERIIVDGIQRVHAGGIVHPLEPPPAPAASDPSAPH